MRSRLTLLFLAAVQVTFLSAVATYWGLQSWRLVMDELTQIHEQHRRLGTVLDRLAALPPPRAGDPRLTHALEGLGRRAQTVDESERVASLRVAVEDGQLARARRAVKSLTRYYQGEHRRLRAQGEYLGRLSHLILAGITGLVIASFLAFLAAIRAWFVEPVRALERATEIMATGDLAHRISLEGDDELGRLARSVNHMAASLAHIQTEMVTRERFALLGELAAYVAHNIRNPLASIHATAQAEALDLPANDPRRAVLLDIVKAAERLAAWVQDLLRSVGPVGVERRPSSVGDLVTRCVEHAAPGLRAADVEVDLAIEPTPRVSFDAAKLEQVVSAVLSNAVDMSPRGSRIVVSVARDGDAVALRVADQGPGIPAAQRGRLFTPFATSKASGTGLGLWLSQKIVVAHGGTITVHDGPGGGTTVEIRLPSEEPAWPAS